MKNKKIELVRSETWINDDYESIAGILQETLNEYIPNKAEIINIEAKERNGLSRFWIYYYK